MNLPREFISELRSRGIKYLTPPQEMAIKEGLLKGEDLLVTSPTASGKTLIAELALINAFLKGMKGIYTTPLKTLANEKFEEFSLWSRLGVRVGISTGDYDEPITEALGNYDILVTTYERLDLIFRIKPRWLRRVGVVVIDEFHNISDEERGPTIELITIYSKSINAQLVCLSATLGNPEEVAEWLGSKLVFSNWRPVKLIEGFYNRRKSLIVFEDGRVEKVLNKDLISHIIMKALNEDYQVIIFQQARRKAEQLARRIASKLPVVSNEVYSEVISMLKSNEALNNEVEDLSKLLKHGVAYHHAGLSYGARISIEHAFRRRLINFVVATPTLAAGINMPARRVVIYTRRFEHGSMKPISIAEYKQMAGRAGRPQYDPVGEAILADVRGEGEGWRYIKGQPEDVKSALSSERALRIHTLSLVVSGYARSINELREIIGKTLAYRYLLRRGVDLSEYVLRNILPKLSGMNMVYIDDGRLNPTRLGITVTRLYIDPLTAIIIINELENAPEALPPLYYLTLMAMTPDFLRIRVTGYRGLQREAYAAYRHGLIPKPTIDTDLYDWLRAYKVGLILSKWISEFSEDDIIKTYGIGAGDLYMIVDTASWLTHAASRVCDDAGLKAHAKELSKLAVRVRYGVKEDLLDLIRVRFIGRVRARLLYNYGIRSINDLVSKGADYIAKIPTFGEATARKIIEEAKKLLSS